MSFIQGWRGARKNVEGEIVDHSSARQWQPEGDEGFDLPVGSLRVRNREVERLLAGVRTREIELYNISSGCSVPVNIGYAGYTVEESGFNSQTFNFCIHPVAESYCWYRGFAISLTDTQELGSSVVVGKQIILLEPWMQPWRAGGGPDPTVYSLGGVTDEKVLKFVRDYCQQREAYIDSQMFSRPWERRESGQTLLDGNLGLKLVE